MEPFEVRPVTLEGRFVRLEPLARAHAEGLSRAAADPSIWPFMGADLGDRATLERWIESSLAARAAGTDLPFTVRLASTGEIVGSTRFLNIAPPHRRLEIGWTWYHPRHWATPVNPECKLLLFRHAFESLGAYRVELRCDARNVRSRAAILKLGAVEEGTLRRHMVVQGGFVRDTVVFAVLDRDWPAVEARLEARLARPESG